MKIFQWCVYIYELIKFLEIIQDKQCMVIQFSE